MRRKKPLGGLNFSQIAGAVFTLGLLAYMLLSPAEARTAALAGYEIWLGSLFPTMFPFFVLTSYLTKTGFCQRMAPLFAGVMKKLFGLPGEAAFAYVSSLFSGHTVGAKIACSMYSEGMLSERDAQVLLALTYNASPGFVWGVAGAAFFRSPVAGFFLLAVNYLTPFITAALIARRGPARPVAAGGAVSRAPEPLPRLKALTLSVGESVNSVLTVGGFIVFFQVLVSAASKPLAGAGALAGTIMKCVFELTGAMRGLGEFASVSPPLALAMAGATLGLGGMCVMFQCLSFTSSTDISGGEYVKNRLLGCAVGAVLGCAAFLLGDKAAPVFAVSGEAGPYPVRALYFAAFTAIMGLIWYRTSKTRAARES